MENKYLRKRIDFIVEKINNLVLDLVDEIEIYDGQVNDLHDKIDILKDEIKKLKNKSK